MSLAKVYSSTVYGVEALIITLEVYIAQGTKFFMVGLPDSAVKESQQRVESALKYGDYRMPRQKIVINLAPADVKKVGSAYDLPLAVGILAASGQIDEQHLRLREHIIMGELALDGKLRPIRGALPVAISAQQKGFKSMLLPQENASEAAIVEGIDVIGLRTLKEAIEHLENTSPQAPYSKRSHQEEQKATPSALDFSEVQGHFQAKRALEIAAAGGHNVIMIGAPGSGKTMLAKRLPAILPPMTIEEALETTRIHSVTGLLGSQASLLSKRPFRSPHHTISDVALVGGGTYPQPGEISLAHNGVLFLDELPEFKRSVLEVMRQPLEERYISISRARSSLRFPASFMLITSMNPCPCGYYTHPQKACSCSSSAVQRYLSRVSGPLLDRIDIHIEVNPVPFKELTSNREEEASASIQSRVTAARTMQYERYSSEGHFYNAMLTPRMMRTFCAIDQKGTQLLKQAVNRFNLSSRAYDRILKVARTIADLEKSHQVASKHLAEAIQYRSLDREKWAHAASKA